MSKVVICLTYYEILNVKKTASDKEIKNAYRILAKKYHPDTYSGNKNVAEEKMKQINEAYDILSNKELKAKYDEQFKSPVEENIKRDSKSQAYYNYETNEYKSPDPRDADYRSYYNYSPDYSEEHFDYQKDYDFTKLKALFQKSILKFGFFIVFVVVMLGLLIFVSNKLLKEVKEVFVPVRDIQHELFTENIPKDIYNKPETSQKNENKIENKPNVYKQPEVNYPQINTEDIEKQIKEWEQSINEWYETDGKIYEQQIKEGLNSFYQEILNRVNNN